MKKIFLFFFFSSPHPPRYFLQRSYAIITNVIVARIDTHLQIQECRLLGTLLGGTRRSGAVPLLPVPLPAPPPPSPAGRRSSGTWRLLIVGRPMSLKLEVTSSKTLSSSFSPHLERLYLPLLWTSTSLFFTRKNVRANCFPSSFSLPRKVGNISQTIFASFLFRKIRGQSNERDICYFFFIWKFCTFIK